MDLPKIGKNINKMFIKDSNLMKNSLIFAWFSIQFKIKTNKNLFKEVNNRFNLRQPEKKLNFSKDIHQIIRKIMIRQMN